SAYEGCSTRKTARQLARSVVGEGAYDGNVKRTTARELARKAIPSEQ
nr:3B [Seal picornavirus type 1]